VVSGPLGLSARPGPCGGAGGSDYRSASLVPMFAGRDPEPGPSAVAVSTTIAVHRNKTTDETITPVTMYPVDNTITAGTLNDRKRRRPQQAPTDAKQDSHQGPRDENKAHSIRKSRSCHNGQERLDNKPYGVREARHSLLGPTYKRGADANPLQNQERAEGNDDRPSDLETMQPYKLAKPALLMIRPA
jgi:hypothetical protein